MKAAQDQVRTEKEFRAVLWAEYCAPYLREIKAAFAEFCPEREFVEPANNGEC